MNQHVLQGPFLTRGEASRRCHVPARFLAHRPDLLHIGGKSLPEVYLAFQFDDHGVRPDFAIVVEHLKGRFGDREICEWLATPQPELGFATPISFLHGGGDPALVISAAAVDGPESSFDRAHETPVPLEPPAPPPDSAATGDRASDRRRRARLRSVRVAHTAR